MGFKLELLTGETLDVPPLVEERGADAVTAWYRQQHVDRGAAAMFDANVERAGAYQEARRDGTKSEAEALAAVRSAIALPGVDVRAVRPPLVDDARVFDATQEG